MPRFFSDPLISSDQQGYQMKSAVLKARRATDTTQMTLSFEPGLRDRFPSLRECIATGIYQRGLSNVAPSLDKFGDLTPIYYLVEKYLGQKDAAKDSAMDELKALAQQMQAAMKRAGVA